MLGIFDIFYIKFCSVDKNRVDIWSNQNLLLSWYRDKNAIAVMNYSAYYSILF